MENFIVSARKYRPKTFDTVIAQNSITSTLKNAIRNNQIAQAFLFCGPRGVGKTTCARIFAKTINCENLSENLEPCGECPPCKSFNEYASFNIHELDAASNNSVDDIRSLVDQVRVPPQVGKYKVYIIDEVHMLSQQAFNAFLKTLEEPPPYAKFILATTEKHKIIPTILSRCQIYDFKRISVEDIAEYLFYIAKQENVAVGSDALHIIAQKADGALRDALTIFDQLVSFSGKTLTYQNVLDNLNVLDYEYFFKLTDFMFNGDISNSLLLIDEIIDKGFDGQHFIIGFGEHLRNLLVCRDPVTVSLLEVTPGMKEQYKDQASRCNSDCLLKALDLINKCDLNYKTSNNKRLLLELTLMQMCSIRQRLASNAQQTTANIQQTTIGSQQSSSAPNQSTISKQQVIEPKQHLQSTEERKDKTDVQSQSPAKKQPEIITSKVFSINPSKPAVKVSKPEDINKPPENEDKAKDFSQEKLFEVWNDYANKLSKSQPGFFITLTKYSPVLKEGYIIELTLDNTAQEEEFKEKKLDIVAYLRKELNNYKLDIHTSINAAPTSAKPYTPTEKYNKMVEKNPNLSKLKNQLGLDID